MNLIRIVILLLFYSSAYASDHYIIDDKGVVIVNISIKDHKFEPDYISLPTNHKIKLIINNLDNSAEEFESYDLKREKIIPSNKSSIIVLAPLKVGEYKFFGDFHPETAQGVINVE
jgi:hypothetical protein